MTAGQGKQQATIMPPTRFWEKLAELAAEFLEGGGPLQVALPSTVATWWILHHANNCKHIGKINWASRIDDDQT